MNTEYRIQTPGKKTSMYMPHSSLNSATQPTHRHGSQRHRKMVAELTIKIILVEKKQL